MFGIMMLESNPGFKYLKNGDKYKQSIYDGVKVDLFIAQPDNWGSILAIRTGPAELCKLMLQRWKFITKGGYCEGGILYKKDGERITVPDEETFFKLCKTPFTEPEKR